MKWYVIRVATGKEKKTKELIESTLVDMNIVFNLVIPTEKTIQIRKGKKVYVDKTYFPGYIFIECESTSEIEGLIKHVNGVSSILKNPLTPVEINRFLIKSDVVENKEPILYLNQKVRIIDGPFNSFIGTITKIDNNSQKIKVSIQLFEREILLDLTFSQITGIA